jgi:hypothetical protein
MEDTFIWGLQQNGSFSVKSMYLALITDNRVRSDMTIWKLKVPLKIKIFMWYLKRGVVLTKDNLIRRNWKDDKKCVFMHILKQYNIYSSNVILPNSYGHQYK